MGAVKTNFYLLGILLS